MRVHKVRIKLDGGITLPQELLEALDITDGDLVSLEKTDHAIVLRKVKPGPHADPSQ